MKEVLNKKEKDEMHEEIEFLLPFTDSRKVLVRMRGSGTLLIPKVFWLLSRTLDNNYQALIIHIPYDYQSCNHSLMKCS